MQEQHLKFQQKFLSDEKYKSFNIILIFGENLLINNAYLINRNKTSKYKNHIQITEDTIFSLNKINFEKIDLIISFESITYLDFIFEVINNKDLSDNFELILYGANYRPKSTYIKDNDLYKYSNNYLEINKIKYRNFNTFIIPNLKKNKVISTIKYLDEIFNENELKLASLLFFIIYKNKK